MKLFIIPLLLSLTACSSITKDKQELIVYNKEKEVYILPLDDLKECEDLQELKGKKFGDLYAWGKNTKYMYELCSNSHSNLKEWILRNHKSN